QPGGLPDRGEGGGGVVLRRRRGRRRPVPRPRLQGWRRARPRRGGPRAAAARRRDLRRADRPSHAGSGRLAERERGGGGPAVRHLAPARTRLTALPKSEITPP